MEIGNIIPHIEALIFASEKPLTAMEITELVNNAFGFMEEKLTLEQIQTSIDGIVEKYRSEFYPFEVRESGGGWQFLTKKDFHKTVAQLNGEKFLKRLSAAALETLSIIAYKQPITKGEIESIRGVSSDYSIQKLLEKELIIISGRNEDMPGKPLVYSTSKAFMDYFGINSPADLPKLKEVFADNLVAPTVVGAGSGDVVPEGTEEERSLLVGEDGELVEHAESPENNSEDATLGEAAEAGQSEAGTEVSTTDGNVHQDALGGFTGGATGEADETGDTEDPGATEEAYEAVDSEGAEAGGIDEPGEADETGDVDGEAEAGGTGDEEDEEDDDEADSEDDGEDDDEEDSEDDEDDEDDAEENDVDEDQDQHTDHPDPDKEHPEK